MLKIKPSIESIYIILTFGFYSIIGYPAYMEKFNCEILDMASLILQYSISITWVMYMFFELLRKVIVGNVRFTISLRYIIKSIVISIWCTLLSIGYLAYYEAFNPNMYIYFAPVYVLIILILYKKLKIIRRLFK